MCKCWWYGMWRFGPVSAAFPGHKQGDEWEVEQQGQELAPISNPSTWRLRINQQTIVPGPKVTTKMTWLPQVFSSINKKIKYILYDVVIWLSNHVSLQLKDGSFSTMGGNSSAWQVGRTSPLSPFPPHTDTHPGNGLSTIGVLVHTVLSPSPCFPLCENLSIL